MTEILHRVTNEEDGIETRVTSGHLGFHVTLWDLDAEMSVGIAYCYKTIDQAKEKAAEIIG